MAERYFSVSAEERERAHLIRATVERRIGQREAGAELVQAGW